MWRPMAESSRTAATVKDPNQTNRHTPHPGPLPVEGRGEPDDAPTRKVPDESTNTSFAFAGTAEVVTFPPGHRTQISVGPSGVASTGTTLFWERYPEPF